MVRSPSSLFGGWENDGEIWRLELGVMDGFGGIEMAMFLA